MKGIIMAGGSGSRLWPLTSIVSKQLLPVFDKPLIYYPLSTLMSSKINELLIISTATDIPIIKSLLGNGTRFGISIEYCVQNSPMGIAQGIVLAKDFIGQDNFALILGDNIFYGQELNKQLQYINDVSGALVFAYRVNDATRYGVIELDKNLMPISIEEKPSIPKSNLALTGLYFFDNTAVDIACNLKPSTRGELEITDVLNSYLKTNSLTVIVMPVGTAWLDAGTPKSLHDAATFVRIVEERQGVKVACPEEIAFNNKWIGKEFLLEAINNNPNSDYSRYLKHVIDVQ
jgi:glucose-1-phosphate thymidylyltransferase